MFRSPDIPLAPRRKFDEANYEEEKLWLERKTEGKIISTQTDGGVFMAIGTAALIALVLGGFVGVYITIITGNLWFVLTPFTIVFAIALYFLKSPFATVELDHERGLFLYEGTITLGGEYRSTRYRGPYEVIEGTLLVRFRRFWFFKSKPFIRFMTGSGYLRLNYKPEKEREFLEKWQKLGVLDLDVMQEGLALPPKRVGPGYIVYYEDHFDRSAFRQEMKVKRAEEKKQEEQELKTRKQKLVEQSKKFAEHDSDSEKFGE